MSTKRRRRHSPEQIVRKLRDADAMLNAGQDLATVLQSLEDSEAIFHRWRLQYGGMKSEEAKRLKQLEDAQAIRSDNGPEFVSQAIQGWLTRLNVKTLYVAPGTPWETGYAESFHSKLRDEFLAREEFETLASARRQTLNWKENYNHHRPHSSLGYATPSEFAARCAASAAEPSSPQRQAT